MQGAWWQASTSQREGVLNMKRPGILQYTGPTTQRTLW